MIIFFFISNDTHFSSKIKFDILNDILKKKNIGIVAPVYKNSGENIFLKDIKKNLFSTWYIDSSCILVSTKAIIKLVDIDKTYKDDFLFDGRDYYSYYSINYLVYKLLKYNFHSVITNSIKISQDLISVNINGKSIYKEKKESNLEVIKKLSDKWLEKYFKKRSDWEFYIMIKKRFDRLNFR